MSASKFLLKSLLKQSRQRKGTGGFTLIELLVAMILAVLVISPLLTLVINLLNTDRQEQAKTSSQQEIQAALDYIAQDMQQAVYVYDASGLKAIKDQIPPNDADGGTEGCKPGVQDCVPVLAFWKRKYLDRADTVTDDTGKKVVIGSIDDSSKGSDRFLYSLVVYYLIKDKGSGKSTWSPAARIGRFEIREGIPDPINKGQYLLARDNGFAMFKTDVSSSLMQRMNTWKKRDEAYKQQVVTLLDYVDDTPIANFKFTTSGSTPQFVPPENDTTTNGFITSTGCSAADRTGGPGLPGTPGSSRVPPEDLDSLKTASFYACVNPVNSLGQSVAQVYLRGNALVRLNPNYKSDTKIDDSNKDNQLLNRPIASVRVAVRGFLNDSK